MPWDVRGKTILITGATSGIGLEAAVELARRGARMVLVGRDPGRAEAARADVVARRGSREVSPPALRLRVPGRRPPGGGGVSGGS